MRDFFKAIFKKEFYKGLYNKVFKKDTLTSRNVTRATFLYYYIILGTLLGFFYFVSSLFCGWPWHWAFTPFYILIAFVAIRFFMVNRGLIWMYIADKQRGELLEYLHTYTHYEEGHKLELTKWVYPPKKSIRAEMKADLLKKVYEGEELTGGEKKLLKRKVVRCPQQIKDGFNEAVLVHVLIHANDRIQVIDDELMNINHLTTERMLSFDLNAESEKAKSKKIDKYKEIGIRQSKKLKK